MATVSLKTPRRKLSIARHGTFDIAGIDGDDHETWSFFSPPLPDPESVGKAGYHDRFPYLWLIGGRYYTAFASGTGASVSPTVYVASWAVGELAWTVEFTTADWNGDGWSASSDGTHVYVAWTETLEISVDCGHGIHRPGFFAGIAVYKGTVAGTYVSLAASLFSQTFCYTGAASEGCKLALAASASDPGNVYLCGSEGGTGPCPGSPLEEYLWVTGLGASPSITGKHFVQQGIYRDSLLVGSEAIPLARVHDSFFTLVNDGDSLQLLCKREGAGTLDEISTTISVFEPSGFSSSPEGESHSSTGTGWDFFYEDPVLEIPTDGPVLADVSFVCTPLWTETGGRRQRAIIANFADSNDIIGLDADGTTLHHLHGNSGLDATAVASDAGGVYGGWSTVTFQVPGVYYDPTGDEYWVFYENSSQERSSVTTAACGAEVWRGVPYAPGSFFGAPTPNFDLFCGQGPFPGDAFYVLGSAPGEMPSIVRIPICRGCASCSHA